MDLPKRKPLRLPSFDYSSPGAYFVTLCTQDKRCILANISVGAGALDGPNVRLSPYGKSVEKTLEGMAKQYDWLTIDKYVIMPNHVHLLLRLEDDGTSRTPSPTSTDRQSHANERIPMLVSTFKRFCNRSCGTDIWQRGYHDHVIRGERDYCEIWKYIDENPYKWVNDCYYPTQQDHAP